MSDPDPDPGWELDEDLDDDDWEDDEEDDWDEHDQLHPWYRAGCTDCDLRADWLEAAQP